MEGASDSEGGSGATNTARIAFPFNRGLTVAVSAWEVPERSRCLVSPLAGALFPLFAGSPKRSCGRSGWFVLPRPQWRENWTELCVSHSNCCFAARIYKSIGRKCTRPGSMPDSQPGQSLQSGFSRVPSLLRVSIGSKRATVKTVNLGGKQITRQFSVTE